MSVTLIHESELESIRRYAAMVPPPKGASESEVRICAAARSAAAAAYESFVRRFREARIPSFEFKSRMPAEVAFMSEILSPCPDLILRARYRADVLSNAAAARR